MFSLLQGITASLCSTCVPALLLLPVPKQVTKQHRGGHALCQEKSVSCRSINLQLPHSDMEKLLNSISQTYYWLIVQLLMFYEIHHRQCGTLRRTHWVDVFSLSYSLNDTGPVLLCKEALWIQSSVCAKQQ